MRPALVILLLATLALGGGLFYRHTQAVKQQQDDFQVKTELTNRLVETQEKFEKQEQLTMLLQTNLLNHKG